MSGLLLSSPPCDLPRSCRPVRVLPIRFRFPTVFTLKGSSSDSCPGSFLTRSFHSLRRSYYLESYYLSYYLYNTPFSAEERGGNTPFSAEIVEKKHPLFSVENSPKSHLPVDECPSEPLVGSPRSGFQRSDTPGGQAAHEGPSEESLWVWKGDLTAIPRVKDALLVE